MRHLRALRLGLVAAILLALGAGTVMDRTSVADPPKPSPFPVRWEMDFDAGPLRLHTDPQDGAHYWYFTYEITNRTPDDQIWAPELVLFTDAGEILESGRAVPIRVQESIRDRLGNVLLETQNEIIGDILRGQEHAREGLAVWPADELQVNDLRLFIGGISGETARVFHPRSGKEFILRKTLERRYLVSGDVRALGDDPVAFTDQTWVMR